MRSFASTLALSSLATLSGCVGPLVPVQTVETTGLEVTERAAKIAVVSSDQASTMQRLGEVTGYSCKNKLWDPDATIEAATFQAKVAAAQRGATAITSLTCTEGGTSLVTNCWQSFTCQAVAVK
jgi:hypothetical protein